MYRYTTVEGKRHAVYAADLNELRQKGGKNPKGYYSRNPDRGRFCHIKQYL